MMCSRVQRKKIIFLKHTKTNKTLKCHLLAALIIRMLEYFFSPLSIPNNFKINVFFSWIGRFIFLYYFHQSFYLFNRLILTAGILQWFDLTWLGSAPLGCLFFLFLFQFVVNFSIIFFFCVCFFFWILNEPNYILLVVVGYMVCGMWYAYAKGERQMVSMMNILSLKLFVIEYFPSYFCVLCLAVYFSQ